MKSYVHTTRGFTLVELSIVLIIVALLAGGMLMSLSAQQDIKQVAETNKTLEEAREALIGFAAARGRLPCPASSLPASTGVESPSDGSGTCNYPLNGYLPGITLGIRPTDANGFVIDAWGNPIRYAIYTNPAINSVSFPFSTQNGMKNAGLENLALSSIGPPAVERNLLFVCASATGISASSCNTAPSLINNAPVVLFSIGKNGSSSNLDETANRAGNPVFVSHTPTPANGTDPGFDDIVVWLSPNILYNRMIAAGRLP